MKQEFELERRIKILKRACIKSYSIKHFASKYKNKNILSDEQIKGLEKDLNKFVNRMLAQIATYAGLKFE